MQRDGTNVVPLRGHAPSSELGQISIARADLHNPFNQLVIGRWAERVMSDGIPDRCFRLLFWIISRSVWYGRETYKTTAREIEHGSQNHAGTGKSRRQITEILAEMKQLDLITMESGPSGVVLGINFDWQPKPNSEEKDMLPVPKRLSSVSKVEEVQPEGCAEILSPLCGNPLTPLCGNPLTFIETTDLEPTEEKQQGPASLSRRPRIEEDFSLGEENESPSSPEETEGSVFRPKPPVRKIGLPPSEIPDPLKDLKKEPSEKNQQPSAPLSRREVVAGDFSLGDETRCPTLPLKLKVLRFVKKLFGLDSGSSPLIDSFHMPQKCPPAAFRGGVSYPSSSRQLNAPQRL